MKRIGLFILPAALAVAMLIPQTALAAPRTAGANQSEMQFTAAQTQALTPPADGCKDGKRKGAHRGDEAAFRVYSAITGKSVDDLKKACESGNTTIWQLARKEGKLDALKTKLLNIRAASLDALVKGGVMTDEERDKILAHIKDELDKK